MSEANEVQNKSSPDVERFLQGVKGLWDMGQLASFLGISVQSLYDYRYRQQIAKSVFVMCGRKLRVNPWKAVDLALKGELIKV